jgi:hypothetical protein
MNWTDTVKAKAQAALAGRTASSGRMFVAMPARWTPHDVWLSRVKPCRALAAQLSLRRLVDTLPASTRLLDPKRRD